MSYDEVTVLVPCHSLEDFPSDLGERDAASLLNAFAVAWHPRLLRVTRRLPGWHRADDPPAVHARRLFLIPTSSDSWMPHDWAEQARAGGAVVVAGAEQRDEWLTAALAPLEPAGDLDPDLEADFFALGTCWLQLELLTRHMYHYTSLDELQLERHAVTAAEAALSGDAQTARDRLRSAFEMLLETRERFYPVDCYLVDLCLLIPRLADDHFRANLAAGTPLTVLAPAQDLAEIARDRPDLIEAFRAALEAGTADHAGGEFREAALPLLPLESVLWQFEQGHRTLRELLGRVPTTWARRRFGLSTLMPHVLRRFGYRSALHVVMDDGLYPDMEHSKLRWEGCDGSTVDAFTRIPLAADSAAAYLRFARRMAEAMQEDQVAAVAFARWPEVKAPWFDDLCRIHRHAPVLGKFVTLRDFFEQTDDPGRLQKFEAREYLTPFLLQAVARQEADPISRWARHTERRQQFDAARWCAALARAFRNQPVATERDTDLERQIEEAGPDAPAEQRDAPDAALREYVAESERSLAQIVLTGAGDRPGALLINPLSFARTVAVDLPEWAGPPPAVGGGVKSVQFDTTRRCAVVELSPAGFAWVGAGEPAAAKRGDVPLAAATTLRNEFFEVHVNEATGGIARIKGYGRAPNRLSQQLAFRFPRERTIQNPEGETDKTYYSEMRCRTLEITSAGPALGEIVTTGDIVDQTDGTRLYGYRQAVRVWRGRRVVEIDTELNVDRLPDGDPWSNYIAARFAWNDTTAALTRSVQQGAQGFQGERFESSHYLEIADEDQRTTIVPHGLPFFRKTGPRMVDVLLAAAGETRRRFRFTIALDHDYPLEAALDAMIPPVCLPAAGPPRAGVSGWFFHLNARNVQLTRLLPLILEPSSSASTAGSAATATPPLDKGGPRGVASVGQVSNLPGQEDIDGQMRSPSDDSTPTPTGFAVRLVETEGRCRRVRLRCYRTPSQARQRDFQGHTLTALRIADDAVEIEMGPYEIADVELHF